MRPGISMTEPKPTAEVKARYTFDRVVRMVLGTAGFVAVLMLLRYLSDVLLPFAAAVVLAYLLNPLVTLFEAKTRRRWLAVGMTISGLGIIGASVVVLLAPLTYWQFQRLARDLGKLRDDVVGSWQMGVDTHQPAEPQAKPSGNKQQVSQVGEATTEDGPGPTTAVDGSAASVRSAGEPAEDKTIIGWSELLEAIEKYQQGARANPPIPRPQRIKNFRAALSGTYLGRLLDQGASYVQSDDFSKVLGGVAKRVADVTIGAGISVLTFAVSLVLALTGAIIVVIYLVFLLLDFPEYVRLWKSFLPPDYSWSIIEFIGEFDRAMRQYFRGQSIVALITGSLYAVGFTLIGLPLGIPLAIAIGICSMVPYLAAIAIVPAMFLAVARSVEGDASLLGSFGLVVLVFGVVQTLQDTLVTPRVMGKATGLKPVFILLGVFIWGKLLGFLGILLAIPLTCLFIAYYRRIVLKQIQPAPTETPS